MGQVSLPIRIALVGALAFLVLWMVALKPKAPDSAPPAPAPAAAQPAESGLGRAVEQADAAVAASEESARAKEQAAEPEQTAPVPAPTAEPAPAVESAPATEPAIATARPTVVALVGTGADDALARELVAELDGVRTFVVPIEELGRHRDLVGDVEIRQAPTILVIGADRRAQRIEGLPDATQLQRALAAAR